MHSAQQQALHQGCVKVFVIYKGTLRLHLLFLTGHDILFSNLDITGDTDQLLCRFSKMLLAQLAISHTWDAARLAGVCGLSTLMVRRLSSRDPQRASKMLQTDCLFKGGTYRVD